MKVLLVGNYRFDGSTSMRIWANALERELAAMGIDAELIAPQPFFGKLKSSATGFGKWLGYIDRYLVFPFTLRVAAAKADVVHICDHGNAMYCSMLTGTPTVVTCHDMLAVRGAKHELPEIRASWFGKYLQQWICSGLRRATRIACVSAASFDDARRILGRSDHLSVILNGLNYPFQPLSAEDVERRLGGISGLKKPYLMHIGSNQGRKNRAGILRVFAQVTQKADLQLVFAGRALSAGLVQLAKEMGIEDRIVQVESPEVGVVEALYNRAVALVFPSLYEGFGWPVIEAQACGCPVVATNIPSLLEILDGSAPLHDPEDEAGMAGSLLKIATDESYREHLRRCGFENVRTRFQTSRMMDEYVALYKEVAAPQSVLEPA
jgi:glycosyltransferase involved in cell wall biosynthesis